jgi:chromosome segregation ATPase
MKINELNDDMSSCSENLSTTMSGTHPLSDDMSTSVELLKINLEKEIVEKENLNYLFEDAKKENFNLKEEIVNLKEGYVQLQAENEKLRQQIQQLQSMEKTNELVEFQPQQQLVISHDDNDESQQRMKELESEINQLQSDILDSKLLITNLQWKISESQIKNENLESENLDCKSQIHKLKIRNNELEKIEADVFAKMLENKRKNEISTYENKIHELETVLQETTNEFETILQELNNAQSVVIVLTRVIERIQDDIYKFKDELKRLHQQPHLKSIKLSSSDDTTVTHEGMNSNDSMDENYDLYYHIYKYIDRNSYINNISMNIESVLLNIQKSYDIHNNAVKMTSDITMDITTVKGDHNDEGDQCHLLFS